ncbi:MAG: hypothetical protein OEV93_01070 [Candidatus Moranbacteria bacterium]|nr:hypothetical protein [Candidatus Moranbacteria bacterium]
MKKNTAFLIAYVTPIIVIGALLTFGNLFLTEKTFENQIKDQLRNASKSRAASVTDFLDEKERSIESLLNFDEIKELSSSNISWNQEIAKNDIKNNVNIAIKEVEKYALLKGELTFRDFLDSDAFKEIAMRRFSNNGGMFVFRANDFDGELHEDKHRIRISEEDRLLVNNVITEINSEYQDGEINFGEFIDEKKEINRNYGYFKATSVKTSDGVVLGIGAIGDISDYGVLGEIPEDLMRKIDDFSDGFDYENVLIISSDRKIVFAKNKIDDLGKGIDWVERVDIKNAYIRAIQNNKFAIGDPYFGRTKESFEISMAAPIIDEGEIKGAIVLIDDFDKLSSVVSDIVGLGIKGENYLVNSEGLLMTPLRFRHVNLLIQKMENEVTRECIRRLDLNAQAGISNGSVSQTDVYDIKNYLGTGSLTIGVPINRTGWCQITEFDKQEYFDALRKERIVNQISILIFSVTSILIYFLIRRILLKKEKAESVTAIREDKK